MRSHDLPRGPHGAIAHTLDPWRWPASSWATSVWVFPDRLHIGPGALLGVRYSRRVAGRPDRLSYEVLEGAASHQGEADRWTRWRASARVTAE
jgi:hypothetical protein